MAGQNSTLAPEKETKARSIKPKARASVIPKNPLYERLKGTGWAPVQRMEHPRYAVQNWARGRFIVSKIDFSVSADKIKEKTSRGSHL